MNSKFNDSFEKLSKIMNNNVHVANNYVTLPKTIAKKEKTNKLQDKISRCEAKKIISVIHSFAICIHSYMNYPIFRKSYLIMYV